MTGKVPKVDSLYLTRAMCLSKAWFWFGLAALLVSCSPPKDGNNFNYLRSPSFFGADTTAADHPFCDGSHPFAGKDQCLAAKKYQLTWARPEDTAHLIGYRIYLDTLEPNAPGKTWDEIRDHPEFASVIVVSQAPKDTLVFVFGASGFKQDSLKHGDRKIVLIDSSGRSEEKSGRLVFGLVPVYSGGVTPGQPQFAYFKTTDKDPPDPFHPRIKPMAREIAMEWERPTDRTNFFDPSQDTGLILGYRLSISLAGGNLAERKKTFRPKLLSYSVGDKDMTGQVTGFPDKDSLHGSVTFRLPDSNRSAKRISTILADSLHVLIGNLAPQDSLKLFLYAIDSNGNQNDSAMETVTVHTTDTTQPSKPAFSVDSIGRNGFTVHWSASNDSVERGGTLAAGPNFNFGIQEYRLTRILLRAPGEKTTSLDHIDTTITPAIGDSLKYAFTLPMKFLPPGTSFHLSIMAVDKTGFESDADSLTVATQSVRFTGDDSALACPIGFIPIPRGKFKLGDDAPAANADERNTHVLTMGSYCIEPYEHRDGTGKRFVSSITYDQAAQACADIDSTFQTQLCSEAEWERSCEGPGADSTALAHGIQSENKDASILQTSCNQGTNDSAMAMSFELRNSLCLTTEGVYDMAGNLSEWVRDPYVANAYAGITDSVLAPDFTFPDSSIAATDPTYVTRHGIRGGNYLKTNLGLVGLTQNLARCSNRDFAEQVRPRFRAECLDSTKAKIAVIYGSGITGHRCIDLDPSIDAAKVTDIIPSLKDTSGLTLLVFQTGKAEAVKQAIKPDSAFLGRKPVSAGLTTRSLAVIAVQNIANPLTVIPDTLDAIEMKDTSQSALQKIFSREVGNTAWTVQKDQQGNFLIKYLTAYTILGTKPALAYYSNRAIGFRCCSRAKAVAAPIVTGNP